MTERHNGQMTLRSLPATAGYRYLASTAAPDPSKWRESRNGQPEREDYASGHAADRARTDEVAAMVAAARAEALRRARENLGPGPLQRRVTRGRRAAWERIKDEGATAS